jgi:hypothetical protein
MKPGYPVRDALDFDEHLISPPVLEEMRVGSKAQRSRFSPGTDDGTIIST